MVGLIDVPSPQAPGLGFSVSHQKVELDIDILSRSLKGRTELTIYPHSKDLRVIRLNCRQCELKRVSINRRPASSAPYEDPYHHTTLPWNAGVHQYHMLRRKLEGQLKNPPEEELIVNLPKNFKIDDIDPYSVEAVNTLGTKSSAATKRKSSDSIIADLSQGPRSGLEQTARFAPITVAIEYVIQNVRDGMHFVGWEEGDLRYPHAFSMNSSSPGFACCLFPCVDDLTSRSTWEISIRCSKSIGDALEQYRSLKDIMQVNGNHKQSHRANLHQNALQADFKQHSFNDEDKALELMVICTGDMTDEMLDPVDPAKKTTSFISTTPLAPQQIGFAIGPFEHIDLAEFRESDEDDKLGQNAVPLHAFCLPGRVDETKNTCLPLAKAIDFFTLTYGSYPFSNYKLCFVDDLSPNIVDTGSLSICSNRLLFPEDIIEPLDRVTRQLIHALASQWMGINIIPKEASDLWVVVGIAYFMADIFMKKLSGNNDYRYRQKKASDRVSEIDVARPSLYDTGAITSLDPSELEFIAIKAPLVLFILDRRLAKASGSSGLSRIISRVFLNAKVGDMVNAAIGTAYFMKTCEKLGHTKLDVFFAQWVFGAGCPRFRVSQRFNKKKLVVEMLIQQAQGELSERDLEKETFMRDVKEEGHEVYAGPVQPVFTGPMTIRIHEADGTPYEHIIEIKDALTKFDIPYNTKYKRLKRSRRQKERTAASTGIEFTTDGNDDVLLYCLGDVLQSDEEMKEWRLVDWNKDDEDRMSQESYEWIRMDADFEWICKMSITMPGYMYLSQLQQDRDVVAQLESIQFMAAQREHPLVSTILIRTLMDRRYFHGIRTAAAAALTKHAKDELDWVGLYHLEKAFQELFCYTDSSMTRSNDFSNRASFYIQCAIPQAIAKVQDNDGRAPMRIRTFLLEKLRFNDNTDNEFSDCHYLAALMNALAEALSAKVAPSSEVFEMDMEDDDGDDVRFHTVCLDEIDRYRRIDEWLPSYHNILSMTALNCKRQLVKAGTASLILVDFLQYTRYGSLDSLRLNAFSNLMDLGMFKNDAILRWFLSVLGTDPSPYIRNSMLRLLGKTIGAIAIGESSEPVVSMTAPQDNLIIEQESSTDARKADLARKQSVQGALQALKNEIGTNDVLKKGLWDAVTSPANSLREISELLEICDHLYTQESSMIVVLKYPRKWTCAKVGKTTLRFTQNGPFITKRIKRTTTPPINPQPTQKIKLQVQPPSLKRLDSTASSHSQASSSTLSSMPPPVPRTLLKPPKKPSASSASKTTNASRSVNASSKGSTLNGDLSARGEANGNVGDGEARAGSVQAAKPKLTLKLKVPSGGFSTGSGKDTGK